MTNVLPKPLLPVVNKPLISYAFDLLNGYGVEHILVNTHHLHNRYAETYPEEEYRGCQLQFVLEHPEILDTGGGIANIAPFVREAPFWVFNGDILTDLPLENAAEAHRKSGNLVTLVLRSRGANCNVAWDESTGKIRDLRNALGTNDTRLGPNQANVWNLRKAGLGLLSNIPGDAKPVAVVEDTAVDPNDLPDYISEYQQIQYLRRQQSCTSQHAHVRLPSARRRAFLLKFGCTENCHCEPEAT